MPSTDLFSFPDDESVNFIDNRLPLADSKFAILQAPYDDLTRSYVASKSSPVRGCVAISANDLSQREESFKDAIQSFLKTQKGKVHFDPAQHFSWDDVLQEVKITQARYQGNGDKGILRSMREKLRSFQDCTERVDSWLKLLPTESWQGSLVCGGLKLVLSAARQLGKMRLEICEAIETIPDMIASTRALEYLYPDATSLQDHASRLYVAILEVLEISLSWYDKHPVRKAAAALFRSGDYTGRLDAALLNLKSLEVRIDKQASINNQFVSASTARGVAEILNCMKSFTADKRANFDWRQHIDDLRAQMAQQDRRYRMQQHAFNRERRAMILRLLRANPSLASEDLSIMLSAHTATFEDAQDRIAFLLHSSHVAQWLAQRSSATLIINGSEAVDNPEAATSLFSAMLVRTLQKSDIGLVLYWFCGQRLHDPIQRMLRNLLCQLLDSLGSDTDLPEITEAGSPDSIGDLTGLLRTCLQAELRHRPVFLILDAVSCYEDQYRSRDLCHVFNRIAALTTKHATADEKDMFPLKFLVTSPTRAYDISRSRQAMDVAMLNAPDEVDGVAEDLDEMDMLQHTRYWLGQPAVRGDHEYLR